MNNEMKKVIIFEDIVLADGERVESDIISLESQAIDGYIGLYISTSGSGTLKIEPYAAMDIEDTFVVPECATTIDDSCDSGNKIYNVSLGTVCPFITIMCTATGDVTIDKAIIQTQ